MSTTPRSGANATRLAGVIAVSRDLEARGSQRGDRIIIMGMGRFRVEIKWLNDPATARRTFKSMPVLKES